METTLNPSAKTDGPDVVVFPPLVGMVLIAIGIGLHLAFPAPILPSRWLSLAIGLPLLAVGIALQVAWSLTLVRAKTTPVFKSTSLIVKHGPYRWSRNPIYISILVWNLGLAFAVNTVWLLAVVALDFLFMQFWVIPREEQYLERKFGEEYRAYKSGVRRWI